MHFFGVLTKKWTNRQKRYTKKLQFLIYANECKKASESPNPKRAGSLDFIDTNRCFIFCFLIRFFNKKGYT